MRTARNAVVTLAATCALATGLCAQPSRAATGASRATPAPSLAAHTSLMSADEGTNRGGLSRDGWYPEASLLTPANVANQGFGLLYSVPVTGQVYAQPVMDGSNVIVASEQNWVYGFNQVTGARQWAVQLGANIGAQPFDQVDPTVSSIPAWQCNDLEPYVGVTSTPVVDPTTGVVYVVAMEQLADGTLGYFMHALNPANGQEEPNFPVEVKGAAQNDPQAVFNAYDELQRVALTLSNGVVYFGFSSHCDSSPYQGYVAGVSETGKLTALWTDLTPGSADGGGIWQAGGGFASDASGQLLVATGNAQSGPSPSGSIPGTSPPTTGSLSESEVRLVAQPDGTLTPVDFFAPYDAAALDANDLDFGSGAPVLLPDQFGTSAVPHLLVQTGKEGYVYLLNAKSLGGVSAGDAGALAEAGTYGGAWTTPGVWPGDGGYIYIPTADGGIMSLGDSTQGDFNVFQVTEPSASSPSFGLRLVAKGPQAVGYGTSGPVVTSNGSTPGSAVVWVIQSPSAASSQANLQAYDAVPTPGTGDNPGTLTLINQWPIANPTKYVSPGVGDNRLFVPTKGGQLLVFGLNSPSVVVGRGTTFAAATVGARVTRTLPFVAQSDLTITSGAGVCGVCTRTSQFKVASVSPAFKTGRLSLQEGQPFRVEVSFTPSGVSGLRSDVLRMVTSAGEADFTLSGTGRAATPWVAPSTLGLTLPAYTVGRSPPAASLLTFTNFGSRAATFTALGAGVAPFTLVGLPKVGSTLAPGASVTVKVSLSTKNPGTYNRTLTVTTNSPSAVAKSSVNLIAVESTPPALSVDASSLEFGSPTAPVPVGSSTVESVTMTNTGGSILSLASLTASGPFIVLNALPAHEQLPPGDAVTLQILYLPTGQGPDTGSLVITPDGASATTIALVGHHSGSGAALPAPGTLGWLLGGTAFLSGSTITLTPNEASAAGSAFWSTPQTSPAFTVNFTDTASAGTGGDGEAFVIADASALGPTQVSAPVGGNGSGLGYGGLAGIAVVLGEYQDPGTTSDHWLGVVDGTDPADGGLNFIGGPVDLGVSTQDTPNDITVALVDSTLYVLVDGNLVLRQGVTMPASYLLGFTAANGLYTNRHVVSDVSIEVATSP